MDFATIIGIFIVFIGVVMGIILEGGNIFMFFNVSAFFIVSVGTLGVTTITTSSETILNIPLIIGKIFKKDSENKIDLLNYFVKITEKARREGVLALENELDNIDNKFLKRGLEQVIDGVAPNVVKEYLEIEIMQMEERHNKGINFFETAGGYAPTLGIMGTVMGLVNILANLNNPNEIGPLISAAFIATLYGVASANLIFLPIANKLKNNSKEEITKCEMIIEGILSLQAGDNPKFIEKKLIAYLSEEEKENFEYNKG